jgi:hypothetical protein
MKVPTRYALRRARLTVLLAGSVLSVDDVLPLPRKCRLIRREAQSDTPRRWRGTGSQRAAGVPKLL